MGNFLENPRIISNKVVSVQKGMAYRNARHRIAELSGEGLLKNQLKCAVAMKSARRFVNARFIFARLFDG